jgi:hypothetical protein
VSAPPVVAPAPRREGAAVLGGLALTGVLHVAASIAVIAIGSASTKSQHSEGALVVLFFWAAIGIAQWVYMLPAALIARRAGWTGVAKGLWIGGALGTLLTALCWGGMGVSALLGSLASRVPSASVPVTSSSVDVQGSVVSVTPESVVVKQADGSEVTVTLWSGLEYIRLETNGGYLKTTQAALVPGARVSIDANRGPAGVAASLVRVLDEGRAMPSPGFGVR